MVVIEDRDKKNHPHIHIMSEMGGAVVGHFIIPTGAQILVKDGQEILAGDTLCKIARETAKTSDITGGLPRVAELFEVRKPKESAVVSEIDGLVEFGPITRGMRKIIIKNENNGRAHLHHPAGQAPARVRRRPRRGRRQPDRGTGRIRTTFSPSRV